MLSAEKNRTLTQVSAGAPMGELLRRYWHPIAAVSEFEKNPVKPVRLMGEDLVLYKDLSGTYGLIGRHCKHRSADLANGYVERVSDHGISIGVYFRDPDGNGLEVSYELPRSEWPRQERLFAEDLVGLGRFPGPWDEDRAAHKVAAR